MTQIEIGKLSLVHFDLAPRKKISWSIQFKII